MKIVVLYRSRNGSTQRYAEWLAQECRADLFDLGRYPDPDLAPYETVIFGAPFHMGHLYGARYIKGHWAVLQKKKVFIFSTSAIPPKHAMVAAIYHRSLPEPIRRQVRYFPIRGQYFRGKLGRMDYLKTILARLIGIYDIIVHRDSLLYLGIASDQPLSHHRDLEALIKCL
ncbi:MAG: flavodoxin domain-containing protein [Candidatus Aminicenantes bacterium]|nr:flavodoxin domain-containing protein [Candidatus Aminicenantes bacterium]